MILVVRTVLLLRMLRTQQKNQTHTNISQISTLFESSQFHNTAPVRFRLFLFNRRNGLIVVTAL